MDLVSISLHKRSIPSFLDGKCYYKNFSYYEVLIMLFLSTQIHSNEKKTRVTIKLFVSFRLLENTMFNLSFYLG